MIPVKPMQIIAHDEGILNSPRNSTQTSIHDHCYRRVFPEIDMNRMEAFECFCSRYSGPCKTGWGKTKRPMRLDRTGRHLSDVGAAQDNLALR